MTRVKRGVGATRKRATILRATKGFRWGRKTKERAAREALLHALPRAFRGRKEKKRTYRRLWQVKVNAAVREAGMPYRDFAAKLKQHNVGLNRKMLADLAEHEPKAFSKIVEQVK